MPVEVAGSGGGTLVATGRVMVARLAGALFLRVLELFDVTRLALAGFARFFRSAFNAFALTFASLRIRFAFFLACRYALRACLCSDFTARKRSCPAMTSFSAFAALAITSSKAFSDWTDTFFSAFWHPFFSWVPFTPAMSAFVRNLTQTLSSGASSGLLHFEPLKTR